MSYKYVAFDLDGTLIDTRKGIFNSIRYVESELSLEKDEELDKYIGPPLLYAYNVLHKLDTETASKAAKLHREYGESKGFKEGEVFAGIEELLKELQNKGIKLAVATLRKDDLAKQILDNFSLNKYFDFIGGTNESGTISKSDILKEAMHSMGRNSNEKMLLVGDTTYDAIGAKEASIDFVAVSYGAGFKTKREINDYKPLYLADSVRELRNYLIDNI